MIISTLLVSIAIKPIGARHVVTPDLCHVIPSLRVCEIHTGHCNVRATARSLTAIQPCFVTGVCVSTPVPQRHVRNLERAAVTISRGTAEGCALGDVEWVAF